MQVAERIQWAVDQLAIHPESRVLEIGCGHGQALSLLADRASSGYVLGIDRSRAMVAASRRRNQAAIDVGRIEVRLAELESGLPDGGMFDIVLGINVPLFGERSHPGWSVIRSLLTPASRIGLFLQPPTPHRFELLSRRLVKNLLSNGFAIEREAVHEVEPAPVLGVIAFRPAMTTT